MCLAGKDIVYFPFKPGKYRKVHVCTREVERMGRKIFRADLSASSLPLPSKIEAPSTILSASFSNMSVNVRRLRPWNLVRTRVSFCVSPCRCGHG